MTQQPSVFFDRTTPPKLATLVIIAAVSSVPMNIFLPSLPAMADYFSTSFGVMQLTVSGYLVLTAILQLLTGPLSDRFGRRAVMLGSIAVFIIAAFGAAMSTSLGWFLFFRALQASIASGMVIARATVRDLVSRNKAASMIGYITMAMALAPMMSPAIGGYVGTHFGWQANFHLLGIIALFGLVICFFDMGETNKFQNSSFTQQFRSYPTLLRSRRFWGYAMAAAFAAATFFAYLGAAPFIGANVYGLSPQAVGYCLMITPTGYIIGNGLSGRFSTTVGVERMMIIGCLTTLLPLITCLVVLSMGATHPLSFFAFTLFIGLGNGMVLPNANAGMLEINPKLAGSAAGLGGALMTFIGAGFSGISGFILSGSADARSLVAFMIFASFISFAIALYTVRLERLLAGQVAIDPV